MNKNSNCTRYAVEFAIMNCFIIWFDIIINKNINTETKRFKKEEVWLKEKLCDDWFINLYGQFLKGVLHGQESVGWVFSSQGNVQVHAGKQIQESGSHDERGARNEGNLRRASAIQLPIRVQAEALGKNGEPHHRREVDLLLHHREIQPR
ncbi:MAG: hypothetical protein ACD_3C00229G0006 [uncultured bacterium (gcode 4)]|uniref:Uncharacterized protein n=1 Tax=uncultured bacterium (gcode 4) TaxID=1234023 RepID=K2GVD3_9BACT|nr:MAG: hypothetical protein ACD_3C00229G0006 [uncultured bacterium (gcode 4)]